MRHAPVTFDVFLVLDLLFFWICSPVGRSIMLWIALKNSSSDGVLFCGHLVAGGLVYESLMLTLKVKVKGTHISKSCKGAE